MGIGLRLWLGLGLGLRFGVGVGVRLELCTAAALLVQQVLQHVQVLLLDLRGVITR